MNAQQDPFAAVRLKPRASAEPTPEMGNEDASNQMSQEDAFASVRLNKKPEQIKQENSEVGRHAARIGSRVVETIGGIPGDVQDLIQAGVFAGLEKLTGHKATPEVRKKAAEFSERSPTTSELKQISEKVTGGLTKAQGAGEELVDEYAATVASLLGPMKFRKALGVAALGTGVKKGLQSLGLGETTQEIGKLGTMLISSMFNPKGVKQLYTNYYGEALKHAPDATKVSAKPLEKAIESVSKKVSQGLDAPTEEAVSKILNKAKGKIQNGSVDLREMMASNRSINEIMGDPDTLKRAKNLIPEIKKAINETINQYKNPEFQKNWKSANEAFGGYYESKKISRTIEKHLGNNPLKHALFAGIAETVAGYPEAVLPTIAGAGVGFLGIKGIELTQRIMANPTLRKYYGEILSAAAKENVVQMNKSAEKLREKLRSDLNSNKKKENY